MQVQSVYKRAGVQLLLGSGVPLQQSHLVLWNAVHACKRAGVGPGKRVVVLGAGPIGKC